MRWAVFAIFMCGNAGFLKIFCGIAGCRHPPPLPQRPPLPSLYKRRLQDIAIMMDKVKNDLAPSCVADLFTIKDKLYNVRNSDFGLPRFDTISFGKHSIKYQGPLIWSKLNRSVRELPTLKSFKAQIRKLDLAGLVGNNNSYCNPCSMKTL